MNWLSVANLLEAMGFASHAIVGFGGFLDFTP